MFHTVTTRVGCSPKLIPPLESKKNGYLYDGDIGTTENVLDIREVSLLQRIWDQVPQRFPCIENLHRSIRVACPPPNESCSP